MKKLLNVMLLLTSFVAFSAVEDYKLLSGEASEAYVPSSAWYWDPQKPGMGLNLTVQRSKYGDTGYFVFGAFYTHKPDGTQAWYTVQAAYEPNPNVNAWREVKADWGISVQDTLSGGTDVAGAGGNYWGSDEAWMGEINTVLNETSGGMPLGQPYRDFQVSAYKDVRMVWLNPNTIEIYIDGESSPSQTFIRQNLHGDIAVGDADYLKDNYFKMVGMQHGFAPNGQDVNVRYITSTMKFERIDPMNYFNPGVNMDLFLNATEYSPSKAYYISNVPVGEVVGVYNKIGQGGDQVFSQIEGHPRNNKWVVLVYDNTNQLISGYYMLNVQNGPQDGLFPFMGDYKFKGYLPPEDQGRISLYPAACAHCNGTSDVSFIKELTRRSVWHLFKIPDDTGVAFGQLPDVHEEGFNIEVN